ncbi:MAG TPA: hypothetical protein QF753_22895 [Victivallales bacterium]|nr:hypothetical protein [Victivallales bacterium]
MLPDDEVRDGPPIHDAMEGWQTSSKTLTFEKHGYAPSDFNSNLDG